MNSPPKGKKLIDVLAVGESHAVDYPASWVDSVVVRASMESAGPARQSLQAAAREPEELSASDGLGCARLAMWVNQSRRKRRGWKSNSFGVAAVRLGLLVRQESKNPLG